MTTSIYVRSPNESIHTEVAASIQRIYAGQHLCSVSTVSGDGTPYINNAFFAPMSNWRLTIWTAPSTVHAQNLTANSACAISLADSTTKWGEDVCGLQLKGHMQIAKGVAAAPAFSAYAKRFASLLEWAKAIEDIDRAFESRFYIFTPSYIKLIDEAAFGKERYIEVDAV